MSMWVKVSPSSFSTAIPRGRINGAISFLTSVLFAAVSRQTSWEWVGPASRQPKPIYLSTGALHGCVVRGIAGDQGRHAGLARLGRGHRLLSRTAASCADQGDCLL